MCSWLVTLLSRNFIVITCAVCLQTGMHKPWPNIFASYCFFVLSPPCNRGKIHILMMGGGISGLRTGTSQAYWEPYQGKGAPCHGYTIRAVGGRCPRGKLIQLFRELLTLAYCGMGYMHTHKNNKSSLGRISILNKEKHSKQSKQMPAPT